MGLLVDGVWQNRWYDTASTGGRFVRADSRFRDRVTADGSSGFKAEAGRYHLYVSYACPWAHRTLIFRALKGLEATISVSVVEPLMLEHGWTLAAGADPINGARFLHEVYTHGRRRVLRARHRAGALGSQTADDRQQRVRRRSSGC